MSTGDGVSVVIPTLNCGNLLPRCLESVKWADEIIIVDMGSTDDTVKIARQYTRKVYFQKFPKDGNFDWNRYYGMKLAKNEWILKLDCDEELTTELQEEIKQFVKQKHSDSIGGLYLKNNIYFFGRRVKHGPVKSNSGELRLVRQSVWKYNQSRYHQQISVSGKVFVSNNYYNHFNYRSVKEFIDKTNKYTELDSKVLSLDKKYTKSRVIVSFPLTFIKLYIIQRGFLDGKLGIVTCFLYSLYYLVEKIKVLERVKDL